MDNSNLNSLKSLALFEGIPPEQIENLVKYATPLTVHANQTLFAMDASANSIYLIIYGTIKLVKPTHEMVESIINFMFRGDIIGSLVAENKNPKYPVSAITLEETKVLKIDRQIYLESWVENPTIRSRIQKQLVQRMLDMQRDKEMSTAQALTKVAELLTRLITVQPEGYGDKICFKLTRTDIAARLNLTVETTIRIISKLTKENIIKTEDHHLHILDMPKLKAYANLVE